MVQMTGKTKTAMERCGLFQMHLNTWSQFLLPNQDWANTNVHFWEVYKILFISGSGVNVLGTIANAQELTDDEDTSITTITEVMSTMQMASNTITQTVNDGINTMLQEMATLLCGTLYLLTLALYKLSGAQQLNLGSMLYHALD